MTTREVPRMDELTGGGTGIEVVPPSNLQVGDQLVRPSSSDPSRVEVTDMRFKGYVQVWDTRTGVMSLQPWWLLWQTMRKRRSDGSLVFTQEDPKIPQNHGADLYCYLNPLSDSHERLQGFGFATCIKQHIPHQDGLMRHIRHSHNRLWDFLQSEKEDDRDRKEQEEREKDRALQREFMEVLMQRAVSSPSEDKYLQDVKDTLNLDTPLANVQERPKRAKRPMTEKVKALLKEQKHLKREAKTRQGE